VEEKYVPTDIGDASNNYGFADAIRILQRLPTAFTLHGKLRCIKDTVTSLCHTIYSATSRMDFGADVVLPVLTYIVHCAQVPHIRAESEFIQLMAEGSYLTHGESGYLLVTFAIAVSHLDQISELEEGDSIVLGMEENHQEEIPDEVLQAQQAALSNTNTPSFTNDSTL
jgi:hypothetical protein